MSYSGTFSGTSTVQGTLILHAYGTANFRDVESSPARELGAWNRDLQAGRTANLAGVVNASDAVVSATGALTGLHGVLGLVGTVPSPIGPVGTYTGQMQPSDS